jgi:hypothetical protein
LTVKVTERPALVEIAPSSQQMTAHAGLVLVRELAARLALPELLDTISVKKRRRGYSPAQQVLALCETLIAGGECLDDAALLRADSAQELLRGHAVPTRRRSDASSPASASATSASSTAAWTSSSPASSRSSTASR